MSRQRIRYLRTDDGVQLAWAPTLVLHAHRDAVVPVAEGRFIVSRIPAAQFVELDLNNDILLEHEAAWRSIADHLSIREKTVRNQISAIFDKLGVWSRAQAIVFARDRHFRRNG